MRPLEDKVNFLFEGRSENYLKTSRGRVFLGGLRLAG
jgi:hypothetical protein